MQSLWLTYSGMSGGQHLTFKPTLMAALLASGFGSYLYYDLPDAGSKQEAQANRTDGKPGFDAGFYGSAKAAEPQVQVKLAPIEPKTTIGQAELPFATIGLAHPASATAARVDQQSQASHRFSPHLGQPGPERDQDAGSSVQESPKAELAASAGQPSPVGSAAPIGLAASQISSPLKSGRDDIAAEAGVAIAKSGQPSPPNVVAPLAVVAAPPAQIGSSRPDVASEPGTGSALANASQPLPSGPVGPAAVAIAPAAPSPKLASTEAAARTGSGVAAAVPKQQLLASPPALVAKTVSPAAPLQARSQPAIAPAPHQVPVAATKPTAQSAGSPGLQQRSASAPLALEPIVFKLAPKAKSASASAGLAAAKRAERPGMAVKPALNSSYSRKQTRPADRVVGEFIFHQVSVRVNDSPAGAIDVRIGGDASLSIRIGALLSVVKGQLDPGLFAAMSTSAGADEYVSFRQLRAAGIDVRYEPAGDTIILTAD